MIPNRENKSRLQSTTIGVSIQAKKSLLGLSHTNLDSVSHFTGRRSQLLPLPPNHSPPSIYRLYHHRPPFDPLICKLNAYFAPCVGTFKAHNSVLMTMLCLCYMGSGQGGWNVFDGVKVFLATPEALMAEIDTAISSFEYAQASALLNPSSPSSSSSCSSPSKSKVTDMTITLYDADIAEEAYRMACVALAEGKVDEALYSLK
ncbi:hypothetical protein AKJ16_DCAP12001, partial [Drosera capensis]